MNLNTSARPVLKERTRFTVANNLLVELKKPARLYQLEVVEKKEGEEKKIFDEKTKEARIWVMH